MTAAAEDVSREGLTGAKLLQPARLHIPANNYAFVKVPTFADINIQRINNQMSTSIKGVILDVDECVAPHHGNITAENVGHIRAMVQSGIPAIVFSNMKDNGRYEPIEDVVDVHRTTFAKPDIRGFLECCGKLGLEPKEVMMVGDNLVTDGGAIRAGIHLALVDPIRSHESALKATKRLPQTLSRGYVRKVSNIYDTLLRRKVFRG